MKNLWPRFKSATRMRFDPDDLDWLMGELHHAMAEVEKRRGSLLYQVDPQLCSEALQFFAARHAELLAGYAHIREAERASRPIFADRPLRLVNGWWVR